MNFKAAFARTVINSHSGASVFYCMNKLRGSEERQAPSSSSLSPQPPG